MAEICGLLNAPDQAAERQAVLQKAAAMVSEADRRAAVPLAAAKTPAIPTVPLKPPSAATAPAPPQAEPKTLLCTAAAPSKFRYNYKFDDPGYRVWARADDVWEEKLPSGRVKRFQTTGRDTVDGRPGCIVFLEGAARFEVFVSDQQVPEPRIYFRQSEGGWNFLGKMEDVE